MKTVNIVLFVLLVGLFTGCNRSDKKLENITTKDLIGQWQPEQLEIRDIPVFLEKQIRKEELEKNLLAEAQKKGSVELKKDGTFVVKDLSSDCEYIGKWSFDGNKKIEIEDLTSASGTKGLKLSFYIESLSEDTLEIDYASVYKAMTGVEKIPFFDVKMIMMYKRIK